MFRIKQLGNGGGLSPEITNSSFIIQGDKNNSILFDCGYNIMNHILTQYEKLESEELLKTIKTIFISHMHEDHMGNLKTLLAYRNYILKESKTNVICGEKVFKQLFNYLNEGDTLDYTNINTISEYNKTLENSYINDNDKVYIIPIEGKHSSISSYGALFAQKDKSKPDLYISGDTIASKEIEEEVNKYVSKKNRAKLIKYQDCTYLESKTHAYIKEIESVYSKEFKQNMTYYHTRNLDFNKEWVELKKENKC